MTAQPTGEAGAPDPNQGGGLPNRDSELLRRWGKLATAATAATETADQQPPLDATLPLPAATAGTPASTPTQGESSAGSSAPVLKRRNFLRLVGGAAALVTATVAGRYILRDAIFGEPEQPQPQPQTANTQPSRPNTAPPARRLSNEEIRAQYPATPLVRLPDHVGNIDTGKSAFMDPATTNRVRWNGQPIAIPLVGIPDVMQGEVPQDGQPHTSAIKATEQLLTNIAAFMTFNPDSPEYTTSLAALIAEPGRIEPGLAQARAKFREIYGDGVAFVPFDIKGSDQLAVEYMGVTGTLGTRQRPIHTIRQRLERGGKLYARALQYSSNDGWQGEISRNTRNPDEAFIIEGLEFDYVDQGVGNARILGVRFSVRMRDGSELLRVAA